MRLPRRGTGGGETPAGRNPRRRIPRRRQTRRQTAGAGEQPETTEGNRRGAPPAAGGGAPPWPRGSGGRGQGARAKARERRAAPRRRGNGTRPPKGGWGPLPRSAEKGPATLGRAGPHTEDSLRAADGPQTLGGRVGRLCPPCGARRPGPQRRPRVRPRWPDRGSGRGAGPRRGPPTNPHQSGVEARRPEPKGKGSGRPGRPAQGLPEPQDGPERAGADGPDGVHAALTMRASEVRRRSRRTVPRSAVGGPGCTAENLPKCHGPLPGPPLLDNRTLFHQYF